VEKEMKEKKCNKHCSKRFAEEEIGKEKFLSKN